MFNWLGPSDAFICVSKLNIIGSDNGLSPTRRQAIIWTNAGILLIRPLRTNFSEIFIEVYTFSFKKMHSKISSGKWRPFCLGLNVLRQYIQIIHSIHIGDELALLDYQIISRSTRCACLLDSGGTIWLLWVYRDPVGIKIDSVGTSTRKWPVPTLYRLMYLHILMSMRLKGGKLLPPSSEDNTCVAQKCIPYFLAFILNTCARAQN